VQGDGTPTVGSAFKLSVNKFGIFSRNYYCCISDNLGGENLRSDRFLVVLNIEKAWTFSSAFS
jgi:hypothetical protein